ncbi:MAG: polS 3 [Blastococcus sp.]|jgi:NAD(P)-dependent dehydrogenase (short-subunit alcohol dehydrogenase family)|nr:polS 3 [Blastococcus sp.]
MFTATGDHRHASGVAVVTGSTSGIGVAIAGRLSRDGFDVVVTGRDEERGRAVVANLEGAAFIRSDLTDADGPARLMEKVSERFGRLDVVVNNAAVDHTGDLLEVPRSEVHQAFEINTYAAIAVLQEGAKRMPEGGAIINITSRLASVGAPTMGIYAATKGAVKALTASAAVELAPQNIRVNAVAPGFTRTPLYDAWLEQQPDPAEAERATAAAIPLGRVATADDVAAAVSFLASPEACYITGITLPVDGGYTAR